MAQRMGFPGRNDESGPGRHSEPGGRWTAVGRAASSFSVIPAKPASSATSDILPDGKNVMFDRRSPPFASLHFNQTLVTRVKTRGEADGVIGFLFK